MIDVLDEIRFMKSLLGKDTPINIAKKLKARIAEKELEILAFEQAHMSEMDAKILLESKRIFTDTVIKNLAPSKKKIARLAKYYLTFNLFSYRIIYYGITTSILHHH